MPNNEVTKIQVSTPGRPGYSAYQIAVQEGFEGTQAEWVVSLSESAADAAEAAIANVLDGAPDALNTLNELAAAIGDDPDFVTTLTNTINNLTLDDTEVTLTGTYAGNLNAATPITTLDEALALLDELVIPELPTLGTAAQADTGDFATAAQGSAADTAVQPGDGIDQLNSPAYDGNLAAASGTSLDNAMQIIDDFVLSGSPDDTDVNLTGTYTGNLNTATPPTTLDEALAIVDDLQANDILAQRISDGPVTVVADGGTIPAGTTFALLSGETAVLPDAVTHGLGQPILMGGLGDFPEVVLSSTGSDMINFGQGLTVRPPTVYTVTPFDLEPIVPGAISWSAAATMMPPEVVQSMIDASLVSGFTVTFDNSYAATTDDNFIVSLGSSVVLPDPATIPSGTSFTVAPAAQNVTVTAVNSTILGSPSVILAPSSTATFGSGDATAIGVGFTYGMTASTGPQFNIPDWVNSSPEEGSIVVIDSNGAPVWREGFANASKSFAAMSDGMDILWRESTDARLRCSQTGGVEPIQGGSWWEITNGSTPNGSLPATPDGIDMRGYFLMHPPYRDEEIHPSQAWPTQLYSEILTQTKLEADGGDLTEWAVLYPNRAYLQSGEPGVPLWFYEGTVTGASGEEGINAYDPYGPIVGVPVYGRVTVETATQTCTIWRGVPYDFLDNQDATLDPEEIAEVLDGIVWVPVKTETDPRWASMDPNGTETWKIGIRARMDVGWMKVYHFGGAAILDIDETVLNANVGETSFTDNVGNTISTTNGEIAPTGYAKVNHTHEGYAETAHTHDDTDIDLTSTFTGNLNTASPPTNVAEALEIVDDLTLASQVRTPIFNLISGNVYTQPGPYNYFDAYYDANGKTNWTPQLLRAGSYQSAGVWLSALGDCSLRICVDSVGVDGFPGELLHDFGTISTSVGSTVTINEASTGTFVNPEHQWVWLRVQVEDSVSAPTVVVLDGQNGNGYPGPAWIGWPSGDNRLRMQPGLLATDQTTGSVDPDGTFMFNSIGGPKVGIRAVNF